MAVGLITYDDASRREDLLDIISNISPQDTPLLSGNIGNAPDSQNTLHEYLSDTFAAASDNAQVEGVEFTVVDLQAPVRLNNVTQIFADNIQVSGTEEQVNQAGVRSAFQYQLEKAMKEHAKDIELALMRGSRASGSSGVERRLEGVLNCVVTNRSTVASGTSLSETLFNDIMEDVKDVTDEIPNQIYAGSTLRRDINGFTANVTRYMDAADRRLVRPLNVYEGDFGVHEIYWHRNVENAANAKELVALNDKYWGKSWLTGRKTFVKRISPQGDHERAMILSELTLECRAEAANAFYDGFTS